MGTTHDMHAGEHHGGHDHHHDSGSMTVVGRILMMIAVFGGFFLVRTLQYSNVIPLPAWATTLILAVVGILIAASSIVNPVEKGGVRAAGYVGFTLTAISILMMFNGWIFHMAGK
ncbi:MAG: hypothetical protein JNL32_01430 [Candidatus Kapabacteria bacterium]|nr:hypothetical protein [Candidatus Kapabacteria bacterium]